MIMWERISGSDRLQLIPGNGAVRSLVHNGREILQESETLFLLNLRSGKTVTGKDFSDITDDGESIFFHNARALPGMSVTVRLVSGGNGVFRIRLAEAVLPEGDALLSYELPLLTIPDDYDILDPLSEGRIVPPNMRYDSSRNYDIDDYWGRYPGICQAQFIAAFDKTGGIRFFARDPLCRPKRIMLWGKTRGGIHIEIRDFAQGVYRGDFELEFSAFDGDWMEAARPYRDWVFASGILPAEPEFPAWVRKSPVFLTYVVCGEGKLSAEPNCFVPYTNALPWIRAIAEATESPVLALPMRWDNRGPWTPVAQWPPVGGAESWCEFVRELHKEGHFAGLYGSGTAWTTHVYPTGKDYPAAPDGWGCCDPDGKLHERDFKPFRRSTSLCLMQKCVRDYIVEECRRIASSGIDFFQLFDQDLGGCVFPCFSKDHGHPAGSGPHETEAGKTLQREIIAALRRDGSMAVIGTEQAAAEPFIGTLPVNDLRTNAVTGVPLYSFLYHELTANYSGNQCYHYAFDPEKSPENLLYRTALGFASGALLTIPLRKNGEVDWGAGAPWTLPAPPQKEMLTLVRNLNALRRRYPEFLLEGRMMPLPELEIPNHKLYLAKGESIEVPTVLCTLWNDRKGGKMLFCANYLTQLQRIEVAGRTVEVPPLDALPIRL